MKKLILLCLILPLVSFGQLNPLELTPEQKIAQKIAFYSYHSGVPTEVAMAVATCESELAQIRSRYQNKNGTYDWGVFQINDSNIGAAKKLGYDVKKSVDDNIIFAFKIWKADGVMTHWKSSSSCWLPKVAYKPVKDV